MSKILISYRREDSADDTGRIHDRRVFRGGSWYDFQVFLRVSNRFRYDADVRNCNISFRLVQDIP
jgi:formylglycine-generating enzyme required for sulfatase activity